MRTLIALAVLPLAACASTGAEPVIVPKPKMAKAGAVGGPSLPKERDGVRVEDTGAVMFVCANSDKHEDKEVLISRCPSCAEINYFYWSHDEAVFRCYACTKALANEKIRCGECGRSPRMVRTKNAPK